MHITFPVLFSLFSIGLGVLLLISVGYLYYSSRNMDAWQVAQGMITRSAIKRTEASLSPDVEYRYFVQGKEYKGMSLTITLKQTFKMSIAQGWISQYPVGKKS